MIALQPTPNRVPEGTKLLCCTPASDTGISWCGDLQFLLNVVKPQTWCCSRSAPVAVPRQSLRVNGLPTKSHAMIPASELSAPKRQEGMDTGGGEGADISCVILSRKGLEICPILSFVLCCKMSYGYIWVGLLGTTQWMRLIELLPLLACGLATFYAGLPKSAGGGGVPLSDHKRSQGDDAI